MFQAIIKRTVTMGAPFPSYCHVAVEKKSGPVVRLTPNIWSPSLRIIL